MADIQTVGILGGMGPQATILLQQRLLDATVAQDDASHLPLLIDMNPQVPSRLQWLLRREGSDPTPVLVDMARRLERAGAAALAMPCNTAHHFVPAIAEAVNVPFLNMLEQAAGEAANASASQGRIGILASPATIDIKLFENALAAHSCHAVWPANLPDLLSTVQGIKAHGVREEYAAKLQAAALDCIQQEASCLLIGCTEFSLLAKRLDVGIPVVDSLDVLVRQIIDFACAGNRAA
ncbi:MAG: aspartate/glutamate racemase family protein [Granulosicoccus sp.]